jgi:hypothetical protein
VKIACWSAHLGSISPIGCAIPARTSLSLFL